MPWLLSASTMDSGRSTSPWIWVTLSKSTIWPIACVCAATSISTGFSPRSTCDPISPAPMTSVVIRSSRYLYTAWEIARLPAGGEQPS